MCIRDSYLAEVNGSYTGSENFAPGHRFGFFPAASVGWVISNEPFFKNMTRTVDLLKLRASYGIVGNDNIGGTGDRFAYFTQFGRETAMDSDRTEISYTVLERRCWGRTN